MLGTVWLCDICYCILQTFYLLNRNKYVCLINKKQMSHLLLPRELKVGILDWIQANKSADKQNQ